MHTIEIDFQVFKALTAQRPTEDVTYNDVLRSLLKLDAKPTMARASQARAEREPAPSAWIAKGVSFPDGTVFRTTYKGKPYAAEVEGQRLILNGQAYDSLSAAGVAVTGSAVNGWRFWECRRPNDTKWALAETLRR